MCNTDRNKDHRRWLKRCPTKVGPPFKKILSSDLINIRRRAIQIPTNTFEMAGKLSVNFRSIFRSKCRYLITTNSHIDSLVASFRSWPTNDASTTSIKIDSFLLRCSSLWNLLNGHLLCGLSGVDQTGTSGFESTLGCGTVLNFPQAAGVIIVAVLALDLTRSISVKQIGHI